MDNLFDDGFIAFIVTVHLVAVEEVDCIFAIFVGGGIFMEFVYK